MKFTQFEELLHSKYPEASACPHGKFAGTDGNNKTEINFTPNGKCYCYYGSYQSILNRLGIPVVYEKDVERARKQLAEYKEEHGKPNKYSLFSADYDDDRCINDYSDEIAEYEQYIADIESGKYIVI